MKKRFNAVYSALVFIVGLSAFVYPALSDFVNSITHSRIVADYSAATRDIDADLTTRLLGAAEDYNKAVSKAVTPLYTPGIVAGYDHVLDVSGTGIIGYLTIEKLDLELPIYHGTSAGVLKSGIGHLEGSSFPIGGANTHCCLTGHRGLPGSVLFSNLDKLEIGDDFKITVLDRTLVYTVDLIQVVEPHEFDSLFVREGEDLCTLITCTPYGVNSHRLLVRGTRRADQPVEVLSVQTARAPRARFHPADAIALSAAAMLFIWLSVFMLRRNAKRTASR